ncbi:MAG TPA: acyl-CoA dehydrogenase family protein, partial [Gammaproteobacteria bacterium]
MGTLFWLVLILGTCLTLAYRRVELKIATAAIGVVVVLYSIAGDSTFWTIVLWLLFAPLAALNVENLRREYLSQAALDLFRTMLPSLSRTEKDALEAGNVWWEGELFSGKPDWSKLASLPAPKLSDEEQAFLDGPVEELCEMLDNWDVTHERLDLSEKVWDFIKRNGFFAMIIPKEYGGLGFSPLANSMVLTKIASHNGTAASTIGVPNSLGPGELLLHYGTDEQKQRWLPGLAKAEEIPCFALTSPRAGSDATAIVDSGIVCKGT